MSKTFHKNKFDYMWDNKDKKESLDKKQKKQYNKRKTNKRDLYQFPASEKYN